MDHEMEDDNIKSTFEHWVQYTFERRGNEAVIDPNADYDRYDWEVNPQILISYVGRLFASPVESTQKYTDEQIRHGFWLIVSDIEPDLYELFNRDVPLELRVQTVKNMYIVFEQLFAVRCSPALSSYEDESRLTKLNPLNSICYMWWDIIPLYGKSGEPEREVLDSYCVAVMERTLQLDSIACQEAALHGLGHWAHAYPKHITKIIDAYLERKPKLVGELREYALAAREGGVL